MQDEHVATHLAQWVGLYSEGVDDVILMVCCSMESTPSCMHQHHIVMPLSDICFMLGTHSRCLNEWENPTSEMIGFFHHVTIIHTIRGPKEGRDYSLLWQNNHTWLGPKLVATG